MARDFGYEMPSRVPAGMVHVRLVNRGRAIHEATIVRFAPGRGSAVAYVDSVRAGVDFPTFAADLGGAGLIVVADSTDVWLRLDPGRYAVVCWSADHLRRGMARDFEVVAADSAHEAAPPSADVTVALVDYAYRVTGSWTPGRHMLHVRNEGTQPHEIDMIRLAPGATIQDYMRWSADGEHGPAPGTPVSGIGDMVAGREMWLPVNLPAGRYFLLCHVPHPADGRPHFQRGMFMEVVVR